MSGTGRVQSIDALRGVAIVLMLWQHAGRFLLADTSSAYYLAVILASRVSAPIFVLLAGYCMVLSADRRMAASGRSGFFSHLLSRVFWLFAISFVVNVFRSDGLLTPNILSLIGVSLLVCGLTYLSRSKAVYLAVLGLLLAYSLANHSPVAIDPSISPLVGLAWFMTYSPDYDFPIVDWILYAVIGMGVAWLLRGVEFKRGNMLFLGEALVISSLLVIPVYGISLSGNHPMFLLLMLGLISIVYWCLERLHELEKTRAAGRVLALFGRHSLAIYVVHQFLFVSVPRFFNLQSSLGEVGITIAFLAFMALSYALLRSYESRN